MDFDLNNMLEGASKAIQAASNGKQATSPKAKKLGGALEELIAETLRGYIGKDLIAEAIRGEVAKLAPKKLEVKLKGKEEGQVIEAAHKQLPLLLRILERGRVPSLVGDKGTGKTTLARQVAKALGLPFYGYAATESTPTSVFSGSRDVHGKFQPTIAYKAMKEGGVILVDEWDRFDPNTASWWNMPLDNRVAAFPLNPEEPMLELHPHCIIIFAANTMGEGQTRDFVASNRQDAALRDRLLFIPIDYDEELERVLVGDRICDFMHYLRNRARQEGIGRSVSTRMLVQVRDLLEDVGSEENPPFTMQEAVDIVTQPWSVSEKELVKDCFKMLGSKEEGGGRDE